jgi:hypothetical protein
MEAEMKKWTINGKDHRDYFAELLATNQINIAFLTTIDMPEDEIKEIKELAQAMASAIKSS